MVPNCWDYIVFDEPTLAALVCPRCFGFEQLSGRVFVDATMPGPLKAQPARAMRQGETKVADFYGELRAAPEVLACATDICWQGLGGSGAQAISYASVGFRLAPLGINPIIVAHELSHIELHERLGLVKFMVGAIPAWFDEGLAVIVSEDPSTFLPARKATGAASMPRDLFRWLQWHGHARREPITTSMLAQRAACCGG